MGAGFALNGNIKYVSAGGGESRTGSSGEADQRDTEARDCGKKLEDFFGFAGVAERDEDVAVSEDAEVAVESFGGV